jgi:hypothetical protein
MKTLRILLVFFLAVATSFASLSAYAGGNRGGYRGGGHHHHHHHGGTRWVVGVNVGVPGYWGGYWGGWPYWPAYYPYYPYAYYPAPVVVQQQPTTYIEQPAPQAQQQQQNPTGYWYYCADPGAYYPYIKECPAGWQRVAPQPSN